MLSSAIQPLFSNYKNSGTSIVYVTDILPFGKDESMEIRDAFRVSHLQRRDLLPIGESQQ